MVAAEHVVQFYKSDEQALYANVARFIAEGFERDQAALVVATPEHRAAFFEALELHGVDCAAAIRQSRLVFHDATAMLGQFMVDGYPNAAFFASVVADAVREAPVRSAAAGVRVYGEMVGVLWERGEYPAAIRLEQLWNKLLEDFPCELFCGYPIDLLDEQLRGGMLDAIIGAHAHLVPATALAEARVSALRQAGK